MKKFLFTIIFAFFFIVPTAQAASELNVYFFYGDGYSERGLHSMGSEILYKTLKLLIKKPRRLH